MKKLLLLSCLAVGVASADIIPELNVGSGGVTCSASGPSSTFTCTYNYVATVHDKTKLTANQQPFAEYFTIYDFNGFTGVASSPAGWTFEMNFSGRTPSNILATDDGSIPNLTWIYTGSTDVAGGTTISGFSATSIFGPTTVEGMFSSQSTNNTGDTTVQGTWVQNVGFVGVPNPNDLPGDEIPEPMTMGLMGSGLLGFALLRRRK